MTILFRGALCIALSCAISSFGQPTFFGDAVPATHVRYGTSRGYSPLLLSNGRDPFLFWSDGLVLRVARVVDGRAEGSRAVLPTMEDDSFHAVWTGRHFLVVQIVSFETPIGPLDRIFGRIVSASGEPVGEPFDVAPKEQEWFPRHPRIAFDGERVLLLYRVHETLRTTMLAADGTPPESAPRTIGSTSTQPVAIASNGTSFAAVIPRDKDPRVVLFNAAGEIQSENVLGPHGSSVSIATDGQRYLAVAACAQEDACAPAYARIVEADGALGASIDLETASARFPSAVWANTEWIVAYTDALPRPALQLVRIDPSGLPGRIREQREGTSGSLAMIGGRPMFAWGGNGLPDEFFRTAATMSVSALPLSEGVTVPASLTAARQTLLATASSSGSTMIVWRETLNEITSMHAGFRSRDGRWSERMIESMADAECCPEVTLAASDGQEFIVLDDAQGDWTLRRFDSAGDAIGDPIVLPIANLIERILWDGRDYLLIHEESFAISRLSPSGVLSPPVLMPAIVGKDAVFASDGNGSLFAVWGILANEHSERLSGLAGIRLGPDLQPLDATPLTIYSNDTLTWNASIVWDGTQYAIAWTGRDGVMFAHVPLSGTAVLRRATIPDAGEEWTSLVRVEGGAAILWHTHRAHQLPENNVAVLRSDGTLTGSRTVSVNATPAAIASLPAGGLAFVESMYSADEPYERTERLAMIIGSSVPMPARPDALHVHLERQGDTAILTWDVPRQPVRSHRVEVRNGDGPWREIDRILEADERSMAIAIQPGQQLAFRVRAVNDAGTGAYSAPVFVNPPRRRSVRK